MKIIIFGMGQVYHANKNKIPNTDEIVAFIDNNEQKWGTLFDQVNVFSPKMIKTLDYDRIVLMSVYAIQMREQLLELGCKREAILRYDEYFAFGAEKKLHFYSQKEERDFCKRRVLIITNSLGYHGGSITAVHAAYALQKKNYEVVIAASHADKTFVNEMVQKGISFIVCEYLEYMKWEELEWIQDYQKIIVNTLPMIQCAIEIAKYRDVLFWLHESEIIYPAIEYWRDVIEEGIEESKLHICAVSKVARDNFIRNFGNHNISILRYGIPDLSVNSNNKRVEQEEVTFAVAGSIHPIKGQDIFIEAIRKLKENGIKCNFWIVGSVTDDKYGLRIKEEADSLPEITIIKELEQREMINLYTQVDVLVIPSRQETMSLIATEGMMYGKACIVSNVAGVSEFIKDGENGFIFNIDNVCELAQKMQWCVKHKNELSIIGKEARKTYEKFFTINSFGKQLEELL